MHIVFDSAIPLLGIYLTNATTQTITSHLQYFRSVKDAGPEFPLKKKNRRDGEFSPFRDTTKLLSILDNPIIIWPSMCPARYLLYSHYF